MVSWSGSAAPRILRLPHQVANQTGRIPDPLLSYPTPVRLDRSLAIRDGLSDVGQVVLPRIRPGPGKPKLTKRADRRLQSILMDRRPAGC